MKKKILFIVGARPNIIKLAPLFKVFDKKKYNCKILHTNQHNNLFLYTNIFLDLGVKKPDFLLERKNFANNTNMIAYFISKIGDFINCFKPDLVIVFGDVDTTLAASIAAIKKLVKIIHIEAGLRSPIFFAQEEINRRIVDKISWINFTTTKIAQKNLKKENLNKNSFYVGNIIFDNYFNLKKKILRKQILRKLNLQKNNYILITIHRYQTIDNKQNLKGFLQFLDTISKKYKIIFSVHTRTLKNIQKFQFQDYLRNKNIIVSNPFKFTDFASLLINSKLVITDSGGVQEEAKFHSKKTIVFRDINEREDLIDNITSIRSNNKNLLKNFNKIINLKNKIKNSKYKLVSNKIYKIIEQKLNLNK